MAFPPRPAASPSLAGSAALAGAALLPLAAAAQPAPMPEPEPRDPPAGPAADESLFRFDARTDPLSFGGNDHLHALLLLPPLRGAKVIPAESIYVQTGFEAAFNDVREAAGADGVELDGRSLEGSVTARIGLGWETEASVGAQGLSWKVDGDMLLQDASAAEIPRESLSAQVPSNLLFGLKRQLLDFGESGLAAAALDVKLPWSGAEEDVATSGRPDVSAALLASGWAFDCEFHANAGVTLVGDEDVFVDGVNLGDVLYGGVGLARPVTRHLVLALQVQAATSAFQSLAVLDDPLVSAIGGVRFDFGDVDIEVGGGAGLTGDGADAIFGVRAGFLF